MAVMVLACKTMVTQDIDTAKSFIDNGTRPLVTMPLVTMVAQDIDTAESFIDNGHTNAHYRKSKWRDISNQKEV